MRARVSEARGRWFDSSRSLQIFDIRGLGKRINPLGLGPRESRFKSEVPDQVLWGSQVVRRLAVNQFMRRFESCPHSQHTGVAFWLRAPLLQRGAVEFCHRSGCLPISSVVPSRPITTVDVWIIEYILINYPTV